MEIINRKYKDNSRIPISEIKKQQHIHKRDLLQPRNNDGELNPEFVQQHGAKNVKISEHDLRTMSRKSPRLERQLTEQFKKQQRQ